MERKQTFGELFRRWGLKSIKLNGKFAQLEFEATDDDMTAAWDMYVELITRIATQGMNVKDRIGKLKNDLQGIVAIFNSGDMDTYYYRAKEWCELLRESWERAVEEILFNDAIQRYNPCVQTQRLKKAPFTQNLYTELEHGMTECSAWCHD